MLDLSSLNQNQLQAVQWESGHLLVLAGPGSGKTRVLTLRVAKLLAESPDDRFRVLGLTFTTKAATEMRMRVGSLLGAECDRVLLTTFHSFCADLLRQHGSHVGVSPDFAILTQDADREGVLQDAVAALAAEGTDVGEIGMKLLPAIDRLFAECATDSDAATHFYDQATGQLAQTVFAEYKKELISNNRLDFPSLLYLAEQLLRERPQVGRHCRMVYPFICVDEFQDTNLAQYRVLRQLIGTESTLFVVADDDQIIYQWNGASPQRLAELRSEYSMSVVQLPQSYRCPPAVLTLANSLISNNIGRSRDKMPLSPIKPQSASGCVRCRRFPSLDAEMQWIASDIASRPLPERTNCVLLGRSAKLLDAAVQGFSAAGVLAHVPARKAEFESAPMRWLHAALRLANSRHDRENLRRLCKAFHALEGIDLRVDVVTSEAALVDDDYLRTWCRIAIESGRTTSVTERYVRAMVERLVDRLDHEGFTADTFTWIEHMEQADRQYWDNLLADYLDEKQLWLQLVEDARAKYGGTSLSLNVLLQEIDLAPKTPPVPPGAVQCMTVHSAKGLEFSHVYLCGLVEDVLPSYQSRKRGDSSLEMQEERRNCFVAITRAIETLTLTFSDVCFGWSKQPSRFLAEMGITL